MSSIIKSTQNLEEGVFFLISRVLHGIIFSAIFLISTRIIDIIWGQSWRQYYLIIVIILILILCYPLIIKFKKHNLVYLIGWYIGIFIINRFHLIDNDHILIFLIVPTIVYLIKLIFKK
jgi:hypothetical protein